MDSIISKTRKISSTTLALGFLNSNNRHVFKPVSNLSFTKQPASGGLSSSAPMNVKSNKAVISCVSAHSESDSSTNGGPLIGVLTIPDPTEEMSFLPAEQGVSYMSRRLVHGLEKHGASVVPILFNETDFSFQEKVQLIDGLILPGSLSMDLAYHCRVRWHLKQNQKGKFQPLLCIGSSCSRLIGEDQFKRSYEQGQMGVFFNPKVDLQKSIFMFFPQSMRNALEKKVLYFQHLPSKILIADSSSEFQEFQEDYEVIAVSKDSNDKEFVSAFAGRYLPITGVMWIPHSPLCNLADQAFVQLMEGFVKQCRNGEREGGVEMSVLKGEGRYVRFIVSAEGEYFKFTMV